MTRRRLLDQNPQRERARQLRLLAVIERTFAARFAREILAETNRLVAFYEETGEVPPPSSDHRQRLMRIEEQLAEVSARAFGGRVLDQGKAMGLIVETKFDFTAFFKRVALDWILNEAVRRRITNISETTRNNVTAAVNRGYDEGLTRVEIAKNILEAAPGIAKWRGPLIARTETHGAANAGAVAAATETGLKLEREWISVEDDRTRRTTGKGPAEYDHAAMNGKTIPNVDGAMFQVPMLSGGTEGIPFPGDPSGSAGNVINCRCATGFVVLDD